MSGTQCSWCGREFDEIHVPLSLHHTDGTPMVSLLQVFNMYLKLSHLDFKLTREQIIEGGKTRIEKHVNYRGGDQAIRKAVDLADEQFQICKSCETYASETLPKNLVKRFLMKGRY